MQRSPSVHSPSKGRPDSFYRRDLSRDRGSISEVELAGLLLTGPPVVAIWFDHQQEMDQMLGYWTPFKPEYRRAITQLQTLQVLFDLVLEDLFIPYVRDLDALEKLKSDWNQKIRVEAKKILRQRLRPDVYDQFVYLLEDLEDAFTDLKKALGYDKQKLRSQGEAKSPSASSKQKLSTSSKIVYEIKFSVQGKSREVTFKKVRSILESVKRLLVLNDQVIAIRAKYAPKSKAADYETKSEASVESTLLHFWRHAQAVYDLLTQTWSCDCRHRHRVDLLLLDRVEPDVTLDFWFHYALPPPATSPWTVQPAQICNIDLWNRQEPTSEVHSAAGTWFKRERTTDLPLIKDLCQEFAKGKAGQRHVGFLFGDAYEGAYSLTQPEQSEMPEMVTLESLLRLNMWERPQRKQRHCIAATIASSHLQLHSTGWLAEGWNKTNILFSSTSGELDFEKLYLRQGFTGVETPASTASFDIAFATLGILLLELCFGFTLDETPFRRKHLLPDGSSDLAQDCLAAWEWAEKVPDEANEGWASAIDWCLGRWKVRKDDLTWRQDFYQAVVEPLRADAASMRDPSIYSDVDEGFEGHIIDTE